MGIHVKNLSSLATELGARAARNNESVEADQQEQAQRHGELQRGLQAMTTQTAAEIPVPLPFTDSSLGTLTRPEQREDSRQRESEIALYSGFVSAADIAGT